VWVFRALIFTLGRTPPDGSWTTPESVAVVVCPNAVTPASSAIGKIANRSILKRLNKTAEALCSFKLFILQPPTKVPPRHPKTRAINRSSQTLIIRSNKVRCLAQGG
jgi:hypothetical protein